MTTESAAPPQISEIVLRTANYDKLKAWYETVLGVKAGFEHSLQSDRGQGEELTDETSDGLKPDGRLCFIRIVESFPYTQTMTLFEIYNLKDPAGTSGLHHMQLRHITSRR